MLTERLNPARTYQPLHQARDLDPLERGYWLMHTPIQPALTTPPSPSPIASPSKHPQCNSPSRSPIWSESDFSRFWSFLSGFIGEARAGWGVWCFAECPPASPSTSLQYHISNTQIEKTHLETQPVDLERKNPGVKAFSSTTELGAELVMVKVYAWGEIARHIYLLLYLASERRVKGMGLKWIDAGEHLVIQMS